jgi:hypothetical protein
MVSCRRSIVLGKLNWGYFTARHSPLEKTPHKAGVERDDLMSASGTCIHMCAERGGSAEQNGVQHFEMQPGEPLPALLVKALAGCADHIGHLYR